jgi:formamidopyrimidine-DNA glycosylase
MPELPEVETMVRGLRPVLEGRRLEALRVLDDRVLDGCSVQSIQQAARGVPVERVARRGKWIVLGLGEAAGLIVIQPRMTGGFWLVPPPRPDHVRLIFDVHGRRDPVWFCDTRRLGRVAWYRDPDEAETVFSRSHGPDALQIGLGDLARRLARTTRAIKPTLMDQKVVAGVGNIYADEVLFEAGVHPEHPAHTLRRAQVRAIHAALGRVLARAIEAEGSSFDAGYRTVLGLEGGFLAVNAMYGREGQPCRRCRGQVQKTRIAGLLGRPTYYCPRCQPRRGGAGSRSSRRDDVRLE